MKKLIAAGVAAATLLSAPAIAADLPTKAPIYKAAPLYNWTGWYGGANVGYGWDPNYVFQGGGFTESLPLEPEGIFGGFQVGYNWHFAPMWLVGIEADFQFSDIRDSISAIPGGGFDGVTANVHLRQFATIRGRFGHVMDRTLFFVTGGVAFGNFDVLVNADFDADPNDGSIDWRRWETGYVLGAGIEHAFGNGWTFKIEYQYLDFSFVATGLGDSGNILTLRGDPQIHTVRLGVNKRFMTWWP